MKYPELFALSIGLLLLLCMLGSIKSDVRVVNSTIPAMTSDAISNVPPALNQSLTTQDYNPELSIYFYDGWHDEAQELAQSRTYIIDRYNCWDYATELTGILRQFGYDAFIQMGNRIDPVSGMITAAHAWVGINTPDGPIYIEPQTGIEVTDDSSYVPRFIGADKHSSLNPYNN